MHRDGYTEPTKEPSRKRTTFEHLIVRLKFRTENLRILIVYKPKGIYNDVFHTEFNDALSTFFAKPGSFEALVTLLRKNSL